MRRPVFRAHLGVTVVTGQGVLVTFEGRAWVLSGRVHELLAPLLDGTRDPDALVDALAGQVDGARVYYTLARLQQEGFLAECPESVPDETAAFWHGLGVDPAQALAALETARVGVRAVGMASDPLSRSVTDALRQALAGARLTPVDEEPVDFEVVATSDYLNADLESVNKSLFKAGRPWLLVRPTGLGSWAGPWVGPLFVPGKTGCATCLARRLVRHRPARPFAEQTGWLKRTEPVHPAAVQMACHLAALETAKFIAGAPETLEGKVLSPDSHAGSAIHRLISDPACPVCGQDLSPEARPVELVSRAVIRSGDTGHRIVSPELTLRRHEHLVSPICGVVSDVVRSDGSDDFIHVWLAGHNTALVTDGLESLKTGLRSSSGGKGLTETQARAAALCEALERYSGQRHGTEVTITASFREMQNRVGEDAIHPNAVMLYSDRQYAERKAINARQERFNRVPVPFEETQAVKWTPVWSLTRGRFRYLPTRLLYFHPRTDPDDKAFFCMACSNGNASGNTLEEAVLQGFCELVERDATALWWYNRLTRPGVDVESFDQPWLYDLVEHYRRRGRNAWALDLTSDLGLSVFVAVSCTDERPGRRILLGLGCHPDPRIALVRAFTEMNQMFGLARPDRETKGREGTQTDAQTRAWLDNATLENQPHPVPDVTRPATRRSRCQSLATGDLLEEIHACQRIVEGKGLDMLVLDQTRPDAGMPVAKVIVPGLRHFWARFAPGRLYEVPVAMGWLKEPLSEKDLNPIPMFM